MTLVVEAFKVKADGLGSETLVPMDDWVEVGVFAGGEEEPLYLRRHRVRSGAQTITVTVPRAPARAGLDPRHLLIDRQPSDNLVDVRPEEGAPDGRRTSLTP